MNSIDATIIHIERKIHEMLRLRRKGWAIQIIKYFQIELD
jgi:hypothetical protein